MAMETLELHCLFTSMSTVKVIKSNCVIRLVQAVAETAVVMPNGKQGDPRLEREGQQEGRDAVPPAKKQRTRGGGVRQLDSGCRDWRVVIIFLLNCSCRDVSESGLLPCSTRSRASSGHRAASNGCAERAAPLQPPGRLAGGACKPG